MAAKFGAFGGGEHTMALSQEAEPGGPLRESWLAHERLCVSEARLVNRAEILTTRTDAAAEAAEVTAAEAAAAEAAIAEEATAAAGGAVKAAAEVLGARAALAPFVMSLGYLPAKGASRSFVIERPVWLLYLMAIASLTTKCRSLAMVGGSLD